MKVSGFRFAAAEAGIKKRGGLDVGLIACDEPATAAAVFTRNLVRAAPVHIAEERVLHSKARAILVNAGNANACTGDLGTIACLASTRSIAEALGCPEVQVLPASTGVIGQVLPAEKIQAVAGKLVASLDEDGAERFADAILTTDRFRKVATATAGKGAQKAQFLGICKGAGMIHPDVGGAGKLPQPPGPPHATMLTFIVTDAVADAAALQRALESASELTFNAVSVDGDTSTNDTIFVLASGKSGVAPSEAELSTALLEVMKPLARAMVRDGEGAEHAVDIVVRGLATEQDAKQVARTVATSPLVKTAIAGKDANWGRLLAAAGRAGVPFHPGEASVYIDGVCICEGGLPRDAAADAEATTRMKKPEFAIELVLGRGPGQFTYVTCDLGHAYVDINAGYRS
ncbi:MAG TPA: bifunctional glutamate N-acetyltransferase/amino-acid acetyltransferase ArgJ [Polyangiaceae bacterium]|nr:bifunctional glutamate N-acetyltransferase/amino-acid acetyltransferase ArgJ [Polyangiaceae bacterium]